jgi:tetratricopeptide (TPR) repeat protein
MIAVRILLLALALLASGGPTLSREAGGQEEWDRRIGELRKTGRQADAIAMAEEYGEKTREVYGSEHPKYAIALKVLADILQNTDRVDEAESLLRRALEIDEKSLGPEHPSVAEDLRDLGVILRIANRAGEAEAMLRRSLDIEEKNFGPRHPRLMRALTELALLLSNNDRTAEARQVFFRLLVIHRSLDVATPEAGQLCSSERQQKIDIAIKQKVAARRKLDSCRREYEKTKTFFTLETMDQRCKQQKFYADQADGKHRAATATACPPDTKQ